MKKISKYLLVLIIGVALFFAVCGKIHPLGKLFLVSGYDYQNTEMKYRYGDLYRFSHVSEFKELIPITPPAKHDDQLNDCDLILIGDSFFESIIGEDKFAALLEKRLNRKIYDASYSQEEAAWKPLEYLESIYYQKDRKRVLILETVERYVEERCLNSYLVSDGRFKRILKDIRDKTNDFFGQKDINYFFDNNYLTEPAIDLKADLNFNLFGQINELTPLYSLNPPMLFYKDEVEFDLKAKTDEQVSNIADNLVKLRDILKDKYNLELVFILIPNKFSIYCDLFDGKYKYDDFIPRFTKVLISRGIITNDLYTKLNSAKPDYQREKLYYMSDTHFNTYGRNIVLDESVGLINSVTGK